MNTIAYDLVSEVSATFINKLLFAAYYMNKFPHELAGVYKFPFLQVPEPWSEFTSLDYKITFQVPVYKAAESNSLSVKITANVSLTYLGEIESDLKATFSVKSPVTYDLSSRQLVMELQKANVTTTVTASSLPEKMKQKLAEILDFILCDYFAKNGAPFDITTVLHDLHLPDASQNLQIVPCASGGPDGILAGGFSILKPCSGSQPEFDNFSGGMDIATAIKSTAMQDVYNFWWAHKKVGESQTIKNRSVNTIIGLIDKWVDFLLTVFAILVPGIEWIFSAIMSQLFDFEALILDTETTVTYSRPTFILKNQNQIELQGSVRVNVMLIISIQYIEKWFKPNWVRHTKPLPPFPIDLRIYDYEGKGRLVLGNDRCLVPQIDEWTFYVPGTLLLPDYIDSPELKEKMRMQVEQHIASAIIKTLPPFLLSPPMFTAKLPGTELTVSESATRVSSDADAAIVKTRFALGGLENYCDAPLIGNKNRASLEVHKADCTWVNKILSQNRVPFYFLDQAHAAGYDNCYYCLGGSKR